MRFVRVTVSLICLTIGVGALFGAIADLKSVYGGLAPFLGGLAAFFLMAAWLSYPKRA